MKSRAVYFYFVVLFLVYPIISRAELTYTFSESSINSDPSDWLGLDEKQVFYRKLTHREEGHSWEIKIGKGGQLYSIKIPVLGELIGYQRKNFGQWVDEVYQHTIPYPPQQTKAEKVVDGDIHQAGYYIMSDLDKSKKLLPESVYSPLFAYQYNSTSNSVSYTTWPQHAHLPRRYSDNQVFINQKIKDLGGGVIEINVEINNWGNVSYTRFGLPWASLRERTLPMQIISDYDGNYREAIHTNFNKAPALKLTEGNTGGWIAFTSSGSPLAYGIGIVYGRKHTKVEKKNGFIRWGNFDSPQISGIDFSLVTVKRFVDLAAGETLLCRYYLVLGTLADIQAKANLLESKVTLTKRTIPLKQAERLAVCLTANKVLKRGCAKDEAPLFYTFKDFMPSSKPLFLLQNTETGEYMITDNPYEISFDPTNGMTKYVDLLGWAVPKTLVGDLCRYKSLSEAAGSLTQQTAFGQDTVNLYVIGSADARCAPGASKTTN